MNDALYSRARERWLSRKHLIQHTTESVNVAAPIKLAFTGGRGYYTLEFSHYEKVPAHIQQEIVERVQREKKEEA